MFLEQFGNPKRNCTKFKDLKMSSTDLKMLKATVPHLPPTHFARRQCGGYCLSKGMKVAFNVTQGEKAPKSEMFSPKDCWLQWVFLACHELSRTFLVGFFDK